MCRMLKQFIDKKVEDTVVLVSGSKGDIGKAVSKQLEDIGYRIIGFDLPDVDISSENSVLKALKEKPIIDIAINCAGINKYETFDIQSGKDTFDVNVFGSYNLQTHCGRMTKRIFIDIISNSAIRPRNDSVWYCASKAAQQMIVRQQARENNRDGNRCITYGINFGMISGTRNFDDITEAVPEAEAALSVIEAAETIVSLMEATNPAFNGSVLTFDNGETF